MWLLIVEALIALGLFVFIVWWTVRSRVEAPPPEPVLGEKAADESATKDAAKPTQDKSA